MNKLNIPVVFSLLFGSYTIYQFFPNLFPANLSSNFDEILIFSIPLMFLADAIHLKYKDLKELKYDIFYLAVIAVSLSIAAGASLYYFNIFPELTIGAYVTLFAINMATDAVSVQSIMSQFKGIPHRTKVLIEGESLGNDATAVIAFFFVGLVWIEKGSLDISHTAQTAGIVFFGSLLLGLISGYIFYQILKIMEDKRSEFFLLLVEAYIVFIIAEHYHISGIFAMITAIITTKAFIDIQIEKELKEDKQHMKENKNFLPKWIYKKASSIERLEYIYEMSAEFGYIASVIIFFILAEIVQVDLLVKYWKEILIMFGITTLIRAISMAKFAWLSSKVKGSHFNKEKWFLLTMSGIKGGLSIILVHALPATFEHKEMFESITIGVILLSTFIYGMTLIIYFNFFKKNEIL
jgi:CPA1 family monovalent cation:H+ antiporter